MGDQYLCLDQLKVDGKIPPPPPSKVAAAAPPKVPPMVPPPVAHAPPPPPPVLPSPSTHHKEKSKSKNSQVSQLRSDRSEAIPRSHNVKEKGRRPLVRCLVVVTNGLFLIVFVLWILTLLTGLHMVEIDFIESMFMI